MSNPSQETLRPRPFEVTAPGGSVLRGEASGTGPAIVQLHGITATRRYVTHGSRLLPRGGYEAILYDARAHGESDPAPAGEGYSYAQLAADLRAVIAARGDARVVLAGHSLGAHTAAAYALTYPESVAAVVLIGPATNGEPTPPERIAFWDGLADGLENGGVDGFIAALDDGSHDPKWRETILRLARQRLELHRHPDALARALREVPRSLPFEGLGALGALDVPALVVASHDEADPGHPYAIAEAWAAHLPRARLISESEGESPLAWQGGRLSREIRDFCREDAVAGRLGA